MRIGISTSTFFLREESENAIVKIKELGAECAELFFSTYYEYRPEFAKAHRGLAEGLEIYSIHAECAGTVFIGLTRFCVPLSFSAQKSILFTVTFHARRVPWIMVQLRGICAIFAIFLRVME